MFWENGWSKVESSSARSFDLSTISIHSQAVADGTYYEPRLFQERLGLLLHRPDLFDELSIRHEEVQVYYATPSAIVSLGPNTSVDQAVRLLRGEDAYES